MLNLQLLIAPTQQTCKELVRMPHLTLSSRVREKVEVSTSSPRQKFWDNKFLKHLPDLINRVQALGLYHSHLTVTEQELSELLLHA
jgi:hypothetical protein